MGKPAHGAPAGVTGSSARDAAACKTVRAICPDASEEEVLQALKSALGDIDQAVIALTDSTCRNTSSAVASISLAAALTRRLSCAERDWEDVKTKKKKKDGGRPVRSMVMA